MQLFRFILNWFVKIWHHSLTWVKWTHGFNKAQKKKYTYFKSMIHSIAHCSWEEPKHQMQTPSTKCRLQSHYCHRNCCCSPQCLRPALQHSVGQQGTQIPSGCAAATPGSLAELQLRAFGFTLTLTPANFHYFLFCCAHPLMSCTYSCCK